MPTILTTEYHLKCPHGGTFAITTPNPHLKIGDGSIILEGDQGTSTTPCNASVCFSFVATSMKLNSLKWHDKHIMLSTDTILSNSGFPIIAVPPLFEVVDKTAPASLLNSTQPLPEYLNDETPPVLTESVPPAPATWYGAPYVMTLDFHCRYPGVTDAKLFFMVGIQMTPIEFPHLNGIHQLVHGPGDSANHKIIVTLTPQHYQLIPVGSLRLIVRAASQRGIAVFFEKAIEKISL